MFLGICAAFDSIDTPALWRCLLKDGVPEKYVSILRELNRHTSGRVRPYGQFSPLFVISSAVRQDSYMSPYPLNFVRDVPRKALSDLSDGGAELLPGDRVLT